MTVELDPKKGGDECFCVGMTNAHWFDLVNMTDIKKHIGVQRTNDPVDVSPEMSAIFAEILEAWTPPDDWFNVGEKGEGKKMLINFFEKCGGFTTS